MSWSYNKREKDRIAKLITANKMEGIQKDWHAKDEEGGLHRERFEDAETG